MKNRHFDFFKGKLPLVAYLAFFTFAIMVAASILVFIVSIIGDRMDLWNYAGIRFTVMLAIFLIGSVVLSTIIVFLLGNHTILRSIRSVSQASKQVAKGDFSQHLTIVPREKELRALVINFNDMVKQLGNQEMLANDFIANVSHEFKNPLSAIQGYAQLLESDNIAHDTKAEYINLISEKTNTLSDLVSDILQLSKLDNQSIEINKTTFRLDEQIRKSILMLEKEWTLKSIDFNLKLNETSYLGSEYLVGEIWHNIIENAIKFSDYSSTISIKLKGNKKNISVTISDNGIGMDNETTNRIFDKFYQKNHSVFKGNGLGLCIVRKIVELHKGTISVNSYLNEGTTFVISLPKLDQYIKETKE